MQLLPQGPSNVHSSGQALFGGHLRQLALGLDSAMAWFVNPQCHVQTSRALMCFTALAFVTIASTSSVAHSVAAQQQCRRTD
jgi:hypothetical protein